MFRSVLFASLLWIGTGGATARIEPSLFRAEDVFELEVPTDPRVSPDGRWIAYVRNSGDIMQDRMRSTIWLVDSRSGEHVPLSAGAALQHSPRWSPDGGWLAYISTDEEKRAQLHVREMATGRLARLTNLPEAPSSISWSPDGRSIAYTMFVPVRPKPFVELPEKPQGAEWAPALQVIESLVYRTDSAGYLRPGYEQMFVIAADGGTPRQLTYNTVGIGGPLSWSPDARTIYYSVNRDAGTERDIANSELHALDVATGTSRQLTDRIGPDFSPVASPDGKLIAYLGYDHREGPSNNILLHVMDSQGGNSRPLSQSLDRSISALAWDPDGKSILVIYGDRAVQKLARISLSGQVRPIAHGLGGTELDRPYYEGASFTVARDGTIATTLDAVDRPPDVGVIRGGSSRRLTQLNEDLLSRRVLGRLEKLTVKSSFDGRPIDAWITLPPNYQPGRRVPLILEIHGGPVSAYGPRFSTDNQLYAAAGYAVLYANPRGSATYGDAFANLIKNDFPGHDYDDLMSAVDAAIDAGVADPDQLFVTGGSGGGILTAWIIGKTNRFKAAATAKPIANWTSFTLTTDEVNFATAQMFGKKPWEDQANYWRRSPLSLIENVKTPTLVIVGSQDYRTPVSEAEQYYAALKLLGVPTMFVKVPGANHDQLQVRPSNAAGKALAVLSWFERYRRVGAAPESQQ